LKIFVVSESRQLFLAPDFERFVEHAANTTREQVVDCAEKLAVETVPCS